MNLKYFIPYERFTIKSILNPERAQKELSDVIGPASLISFINTTDKPYQGTLTGTHFSIHRNINYRNSFIPMIQGEILPERAGCSVRFTMMPHILVLIFMVMWISMPGMIFVFSVGSLIVALVQNSSIAASWTAIEATGLMILLGYTLLLGAFKFESSQSKEFFRELLYGRLSNDDK